MSNYQAGPSIPFALYNNKYKKTDKHPDLVGTITLPRAFLKAIVEQAKKGADPELRIAGWDSVSKGGLAYKRLKLELSEKKEPEAQSDDDDMPW